MGRNSPGTLSENGEGLEGREKSNRFGKASLSLCTLDGICSSDKGFKDYQHILKWKVENASLIGEERKDLRGRM